MADDIVQVIQDAREDAVSLSQFIYYPASTMVERRLAPSIHTLNYYLNYLHGLEKVYSQPTGTVEVNGEVVKTVRQSINDAIDSVMLGNYQTQLETGLSNEVDRAIIRENNIEDALEAEVIRATNRENVIEDALEAEVIRATDAEGVITQNLSDLNLEVDAQKLDTGIKTKPQEIGQIEQYLSELSKLRLTPQSFGVIGNGIADDTESLRAYHNYCNLRNIVADYSSLSAIAVQANAKIIVNTDWDLNGIPIYLLDGIKTTPAYTDLNVAFRVFDALTPVVRVTGAMADDSKHVNSLTPTKGLFDGTGYAKLFDNSTLIPDRAATGTVTYKQAFQVIKGQVMHPLSMSLTGTNVIVDYRLNSNRGSLTVRNINLINNGTFNNQKLIAVERNKVKVIGFTLKQVSDAVGIKIHQLISVTDSAQFLLTDVESQGVDAESGSYIFDAYGCAGLHLDKINTAKGWSWIGTNFTNGFFVTNSSFSVIDGHESMHNVFVDNVSFHDSGLKLGWGGGSIMMNNITLHNASAFYGRPDYGSWFNGEITINNVTVKEGYQYRPIIYSGYTGATSMVVTPFKSATVRNVTIAQSTLADKKDAYLILCQPKVGMIVNAPSAINISGVNTTTDMNVSAQIDYGGMRGFGYSFLTLSDIKGRTFNLKVLKSNTLNDSEPAKVIVSLSDIKPLNGVDISSQHNLAAIYVNDVHNISNCVLPLVAAMGISTKLIISNSTIANNTTAGKFGVTSANGTSQHTRISNTAIIGNFDLTGVDSLQGVRLVGAPILPAGVTTANAFSGWVRA